MNFDDKDNNYPERLFLKGDPDEIVTQLIKDIGMDHEFDEVIKKSKTVPQSKSANKIKSVSFKDFV